MIVYEITATVRDDLIDAFERFMQNRHIPDLLATGFFQEAELARITDGLYRVRYLTADRQTLESYFATAADRLRADFVRHFPEGIEVSREILEVLQSW